MNIKTASLSLGFVGAMVLPAHAQSQTVKCSQNPTQCLMQAAQACSGSYRVLDSNSHAGGLLGDAVPGPVTWYEMSFQCGPSGPAPTFAFRGPPVGGGIMPPAGGGGLAGAGIAVADMGRFCVGEASAAFGQRPQNMATLPVENSGGMYLVYGQYPPDGANVTTFTCTFGADRVFQRVTSP